VYPSFPSSAPSADTLASFAGLTFIEPEEFDPFDALVFFLCLFPARWLFGRFGVLAAGLDPASNVSTQAE
jgi:hypothetical protein